MAFYHDTERSTLTNRKPAAASQAPLFVGDNVQPFKYHDLTESSKRLAPAQLAYLNSAVLFFEIYKTGW